MEFFMRTVKSEALIFGPSFLKIIIGLANKGKKKYQLLNDIRDSGVFCF